MSQPVKSAKFPLGQVLATPGALAVLKQAQQSPEYFLTRHARGDWGEVCEEDQAANEQSLRDGSRLLSAYRTLRNVKLWVITEAADERGIRSATTLLLPEEY